MDKKELSNEELWKRAGEDKPISREELGITRKSTELNGIQVLNEGITVLSYNHNKKDNKAD